MSLKNKRILIVGGSSGIGFAVAKAAHADGAQIVIASSKLPNVTAAVTQLGQGATGVVMNVTDEKSVESACASLGAIDHLVFTAAIGVRRGVRRSPTSISAAPMRCLRCASGVHCAWRNMRSGCSRRAARSR